MTNSGHDIGFQPEKEITPALHYFARFTAFAALILLVAGGLVTSTESALSVPDWPLSYGRFFPPMKGGIFFEHGHRMIAGAVGFLTLALVIWIWLKDRRLWVRFLALGTATGIAVQAALGGLTVLFSLPSYISIAHAILGQVVFCLILSIAQVTSKWYQDGSPVLNSGNRILQRVGLGALALAFVQLVLGAIVRHTGGVFFLHLLGALLLVAFVGAMTYKIFGEHGNEMALVRPAIFLVTFLFIQLFLGIATFMALSGPLFSSKNWEVIFATAHTICGALVLGVLTLLSLRAYRLGA